MPANSNANSPANPPFPPDQAGMDRRTGLDRRDFPKPASGGADLDENTGLERRRGPGRRRSDFTKSAEEGEMTPEQFLFVMAIDAFKKANNRMYPTWTDVLEVVRLLGYRKTQPSHLTIRGAEDWKEAPTAPHGVRTKPGHPEEQHPMDRPNAGRRAA